MQLDPALKTRIEDLVHGHRVVLFMKGTRAQPRCGFSAAATGALDTLLDDYVAVDVLADPELREGIKAYGNWPTIPQLYVGGELVGGSDIILQMVNSGELHRTLGVPEPDRSPPAITITDEAAEAIRGALEEAGDDTLHLSIDAAYRAQFMLKPRAEHEIRSIASGIPIDMDLATAQRARGLVIEWLETATGSGLSIRNPNAPPPVASMSVAELKQALDAGAVTVLDVRPGQDRALAPFARATVLDQGSLAAIEALPKDTPLAFLCHHGNSSRGAAEHFRGLGFRNVRNVEGGIDAWSREIDPSVPRY
jgi:monothiol glutaredoxin